MPDAETKRNDEVFGRIAVQKMFITADEAKSARREQEALLAMDVWTPLSEILVRSGVLTLSNVDEIAAIQQRILLICPGCSALFNIEGLEPGYQFICKRCKAVLVVPTPSGSEVLKSGPPTGEYIPELEEDTARLAGKTIGGCRVESLIGRGGMGAVYKAAQLSLNRTVALKVLPKFVSDDQQSIARFEREARTIALLSHPNIVQIFDMGKDETGLYFIVMEFIEGGALVVDPENLLPEETALRYVTDAAEGLGVAHAEGILHRDVKPDNLLLDKYDRVKVVDFGLARGVDATVQLTGSGAALGTPAFMAPEQGMGKGADHRADIYSLGVTLYTLLTGQYPFLAESPIGMVVAHANEPVPDVREMAPHVSKAAAEIAHRAMAKEPDDRFQDAKEFAEALRNVGRSPSRKRTGPHPKKTRFVTAPDARVKSALVPTGEEAGPGTSPGPSASKRGEKRWPWVVGAAVVLVLLLAVVLALVLPRKPESTAAKTQEAPTPAGSEPKDSIRPLEILQGGRLEKDLSVPAGEYLLEKDLIVDRGVTLEIQAGAVFRFGRRAGIRCKGRLLVKGTEARRVKFGPAEDDGWMNISLEGKGADGSTIRNAVVENGRGRPYPDFLTTITLSDVDPMGAIATTLGGGFGILQAQSVVLENVRIQNGSARLGGGAVFASNAGLSISSCEFTSNKAVNGGSLYFFQSRVVVEDSDFFHNDATNGGAFALDGGSELHVKNGEFSRNTSSARGGCGFAHRSSKLIVRSGTFSDNASTGSGCLSISDSTVDLEGCEFRKNRSTGSIAGALYASKSEAKLNRCRFLENTSVKGGGALYGSYCKRFSLLNSHFEKNVSTSGGACGFAYSSLAAEACHFVDN
ncbi:MAG: protein kinase domain-containing protein, partial [Planctomycetota bacterium]